MIDTRNLAAEQARSVKATAMPAAAGWPVYSDGRMDGSAACVGFGGTVAFVAMLGAMLLLVLSVVWVNLPTRPATVGDLSLASDYRAALLTDFTCVDDKNCVAVSLDGVHRIRADALPLGLWHSYSRAKGDVLSERGFRQVLEAAGRLFFVGEKGSLTTADQRFAQWRVLFGERGFAPDLALEKELSALAIAPTGDLFLVGTRTQGAAVYDTRRRQWTILPIEVSGANPEVFEIAFDGHMTWLATRAGLLAFTVDANPSGIVVAPDPSWTLPFAWVGSAVVHVRLVTGAENRLHVVTAHGGHVSRKVGSPTWDEHVHDAPAALRGINGEFALSGLVVKDAVAHLVVPSHGVIRYDANVGQYSALFAGLPGADGSRAVRQLEASSSGELYLLAGDLNASSVFRLNENQSWQRVSSDRNVAGFGIAGSTPIVLLTDGRVMAYGAAAITWFGRGQPAAPTGPSTTSGARLWIGGSDGSIHTYSTWDRTWGSVSIGGGDKIRQIRGSNDVVAVVKANGEAGTLGPRDGTYTSVFGPSELQIRTSPVVSATQLGAATWFIRDAIPYEYSSVGKTISARVNGLPAERRPEFVRSTAARVALGVSGGNGLEIFTNGGPEWKSSGINISSWSDLAIVADAFVARTRDGSVLVDADSRTRQALFSGLGVPQFKKLAADPFGGVWGLTETGDVLRYRVANGGWTRVLQGAATLDLMRNGESVRLVVGDNFGLREYALGLDALSNGEMIVQGTILSTDLDGDRLWVVSVEGGTRRVRSIDGTNRVVEHWVSMVDGVALTSADWDSAVWMDFEGEELRIITAGGIYATYGLETRAWSLVRQRAVAPQAVPSEAGVLWWMNNGRLNAHDFIAAKDIDLPTSFDPGWFLSAAASLDVALLVLPAIAAIAFGWGIVGPLVGGRDGRRRRGGRQFALLLTAGVCFGLGVGAWFATEYFHNELSRLDAFTRAELGGGVRTFSIGPGRLLVETQFGVCLFGRDGSTVVPRECRPGLRLTPRRVPVPERVDRSGSWRLQHDGRRYQLARRIGEQWIEWRVGAAGFESDQIEHVAAAGDVLLAATPSGLQRLSMADSLAIRELLPQPSGTARRFRRLSGAVWAVATGSAPLRMVNGRWVPGVPGREGLSDGGVVRWTRDVDGDALPPADFDQRQKRFVRDLSTAIAAGVGSVFWVETPAGWRSATISPSGIALSLPGAAHGELTTRTEWSMNPQWRVAVSQTRTEDVVSFSSVALRQSTFDPFGRRGRLPDEDARTVAVSGARFAFGTAAGVFTSDGALMLPGQPVEALAWTPAGLFARTSTGDFRRGDAGWQPAAVSNEMFFGERRLSLPIGPALVVGGTERFVSGEWRTTLEDYDDGRFAIDRIFSIFVDQSVLFAAAGRGLQELTIDRVAFTQQGMSLTGKMSAIRRDATRSVCALSDRETFCRTADGHWRSRRDADAVNPFTSPLIGKLNGLVSWRRDFQAGGDRWTLFTSAGVMPFKEGKLASDFVLTTASANGRKTAVTAAGILDGGTLIPLPPGEPLRRVEAVADGFVARSDKSYRFERRPPRWTAQSAPELFSTAAHFNGLAWTFSQIDAPAPSITGPAGLSVLSDTGRFEFDVVRSVAARGDSELLLTEESGIEVWDVPSLRPISYIGSSEPYRQPPRTASNAAYTSRVEWSSGSSTITLSVRGGAIEIAAGQKVDRIPFAEKPVAIVPRGRFVWLLTPKQLYRVTLPHR